MVAMAAKPLAAAAIAQLESDGVATLIGTVALQQERAHDVATAIDSILPSARCPRQPSAPACWYSDCWPLRGGSRCRRQPSMSPN